MDKWDVWLKACFAHSRTQAFHRKVNQAQVIAWEGHGKGRLYGSLSGGKDSTALAGLLVESKIDVMWCHAHSSLNLPDTLPAAHAVADRLNLDFDIIEPQQDALEALDTLPKHKPLFETIGGYLNRFTSGALLVQYGYENEYDGHFDGVRARESDARKKMLTRYGPVYQSVLDKKWVCRPLAWWTALDVFAFCVSRELPLHPFYRRCVNESGIDPCEIRIDWLFCAKDGPNRHGCCVPIKKFYPSAWRRLVSIRPELAGFA